MRWYRLRWWILTCLLPLLFAVASGQAVQQAAQCAESKVVLTAALPAAAVVAWGDADGDGDIDLAVSSLLLGSNVTLFFNPGHGADLMNSSEWTTAAHLALPAKPPQSSQSQGRTLRHPAP